MNVHVLLEDGDSVKSQNVRLVDGYSHGKRGENMEAILVIFLFVFVYACAITSTVDCSLMFLAIAALLLGGVMMITAKDI